MRLEIPAKVDVAALSLKAGLEAEFLPLQGTSVFSLEAFQWIRPTHIKESNLHEKPTLTTSRIYLYSNI